MDNFNNKTIKEIALETPASVRVFEELKIDFCCGGNIPFADACQTANVSSEFVSKKISATIANSGENQNQRAEEMSASELIDYILEKHHTFTRQEIGRLTNLMEKVAYKHGDKSPELFELKTVFKELCNDLTNHMQKEEFILFPYVKNLSPAKTSDLTFNTPHFGTVQNPIQIMNREHEEAGEMLKRMREITKDYLVPEDACPSFKALYRGIEELEKDLHRHIHLENNVLFPLSVELEKQSFHKTANTAKRR